MIQGVELPTPEDLEVEHLSFHTDSVKHWLLDEPLLLVLKVKQAPVEECGSREADIVKLINPGFVECLA